MGLIAWSASTKVWWNQRSPAPNHVNLPHRKTKIDKKFCIFYGILWSLMWKTWKKKQEERKKTKQLGVFILSLFSYSGYFGDLQSLGEKQVHAPRAKDKQMNLDGEVSKSQTSLLFWSWTCSRTIFTFNPVDVEMFTKKNCRCHPHILRHPSCRPQFSHSCIHQREASLPCLPSSQSDRVGIPGLSFIVGPDWFIPHLRKDAALPVGQITPNQAWTKCCREAHVQPGVPAVPNKSCLLSGLGILGV